MKVKGLDIVWLLLLAATAFTWWLGHSGALVGATPVASRAPPVARRNGRARGVPNRDFPRAGVLSL